MYRPISVLLSLLVLAACATPQKQCIAKASLPLRKAERKAKEIEGNLERGYAVHRQTILVPTVDLCKTRDGAAYRCFEHKHRIIETPVAIDAEEERRKLAALKIMIAEEVPKVALATETCIAQYPE
ncbi:hypothetical protein O2N63_05835 [Aliiroseovarius sp. KMU-50]|uniref:Lipoprotein n=1 Tax=Aliiroseovarius salicola TaxID=3009082 RepID=A0ABT4VZC0_9RHOB|nr:hypothetical protein [Aliiroseovarius sp. KMU-50]MDA5093607.1 hypothetical protein [Aliiroseovarius sp. KMU-50]